MTGDLYGLAGVPNLAAEASPSISKEHHALSFPPHVQIGIDKLHEEGFRGKGIKIAVLDTGFDYKQAPFGYKIGPGEKITYGFDWTADLSSGKERPQDPFVDCSHHGTHVLGLLAADQTEFGVLGAAPEATFELHRVFDCDDHVDEDVLFKALTAAWQRGADVINCSWGLQDKYESALASLASLIMKNGTTFLQFTAGNNGPRASSLSIPGGAHDVPAVGSVDCTHSAAYFWNGTITVDGIREHIRWVPGLTNHTVTRFPPALSVWTPLEAVPENVAWHPRAFPANLSIPDLDHNLLLCRLDWFSIYHKEIIEIVKPRYMLLYHPVSHDVSFPGMYFPAFPASQLPDTEALATIEHELAIRLVRHVQAGRDIKMTLTDKDSHSSEVVYAVNERTGGRMTEFSAWGPNLNGEAGVTFAAPGGRILSTVPRLYGGFGQSSGTSMAAPLTAGVAALMKQKYPNWNPATIRNVLATTARPMPYTDNSTHDYGLLAPVIQQGGGLIDAFTALHTPIIVNISVLDFLDLRHKPHSLGFSVTNEGVTSIDFQCYHIGAASGYAKMDYRDTEFVDDKFLQQSQSLTATYARVKVEPESFTVHPGQAMNVRVSIVEPPLIDAGRFPFYGGYIALNSTNGKHNLTIPYSGIAASLPEDLPLLQPHQVVATCFNVTRMGSTMECKANSTFHLQTQSGKVDSPSGLWPGVHIDRPLFPMRGLRIELVKVDANAVVATHTTEDREVKHSMDWYLNSKVQFHALNNTGRYLWRLEYLGLAATKAAGNYLRIETESFEITVERMRNPSYALQDVLDVGCDIEWPAWT